MASDVNPNILGPIPRGLRALQLAREGGFLTLDPAQIVEQLTRGLRLIAAGQMAVGGPAQVWEFARLMTDQALQKYRFTQENFALGGRTAEKLEESLGLPDEVLSGISPFDTGRTAASIIELEAPSLIDAIPPEFRRERGGGNVTIEFRPPPPPPPPKVEFRAEAPPSFGGERTFRLGEVAPSPPQLAAGPETYATLDALRAAASGQGSDRYVVSDQFVTLYRPVGEGWQAVGALHTPTGYLVTFEWHTILGVPPADAIPIGSAPPTPSPPSIEVARRPPTQTTRQEAAEGQGEGKGSGGGVPMPSIQPSPPAVPPPPEVPPPSPLAPPRKGKLQEGPQKRLALEYEVPLTEKYRPLYLDDLVGNPAIIQQLQYIARTGNAPPCIVFVGPPGVGKTTAARALARTYFKELAEREAVSEDLFGPQTFFEVGTEDIRIDPAEFVESRLIPFMRSMTMFGGKSRGWVLLDDVQKLSPQTQQSLLRPLERYGKSKTVIFAVNSVKNLAPALRSRCEEGFFEFQPIEPKDVARRLRDISAQEGIALPNQEGEIDRIAKASKGDVRVALGLLAREWRAYQASRVG